MDKKSKKLIWTAVVVILGAIIFSADDVTIIGALLNPLEFFGLGLITYLINR